LAMGSTDRKRRRFHKNFVEISGVGGRQSLLLEENFSEEKTDTLLITISPCRGRGAVHALPLELECERPQTMTPGCRSAKPKGEIAARHEVARGGVAGPQVDEGGGQAGARA